MAAAAESKAAGTSPRSLSLPTYSRVLLVPPNGAVGASHAAALWLHARIGRAMPNAPGWREPRALSAPAERRAAGAHSSLLAWGRGSERTIWPALTLLTGRSSIVAWSSPISCAICARFAHDPEALMRAPISEARFGILDKFPILEVCAFTSAKYHPAQSLDGVQDIGWEVEGL